MATVIQVPKDQRTEMVGRALGTFLGNTMAEREEEKKKQEKFERTKQLLQELQNAPDRKTAIGIAANYQDVIEDAEDWKTYGLWIDQILGAKEDLQTTEFVTAYDENGVETKIPLTKKQQQMYAEGKLDINTLPTAQGRNLTFDKPGTGTGSELFEFFDKDNKFVGKFTLQEGKGKGFKTKQTVEQENTQRTAERLEKSLEFSQGKQPAQFEAVATGNLRARGFENPTKTQITDEVAKLEKIEGGRKSLVTAFNGNLDANSIATFGDARDSDRYLLATDIMSELIRADMPRSKAVLMAREIAYDRIAFTGIQGGQQGRQIGLVKIEKGKPENDADMKEGRIYKDKEGYHIRFRDKVIDITP